MTNDSDTLQPLWTRGLRLLMPHVEREAIIKTVQRTTLHLQDSWSDEAVSWRYAVGGGLELHINERVLDWYEVEQDEVMLFAALMTAQYFADYNGQARAIWNRRNVTDLQLSMCRLIGCCPSTTDSPSERWRLIAARDVQVSDETLARFPTECRVCKRFVNSDEPRSDSHSICRVYVKSVIIPQLKAHQQAVKILTAGGIDK